MSTTVLLNGKIVTGDGKTLIETGSVVIDGDRIQDVLAGPRDEQAFSGARRVIRAENLLIMPGVINHHTHGIVRGPLYPSGAEPLESAAPGRVLWFAKKPLIAPVLEAAERVAVPSSSD